MQVNYYNPKLSSNPKNRVRFGCDCDGCMANVKILTDAEANEALARKFVAEYTARKEKELAKSFVNPDDIHSYAVTLTSDYLKYNANIDYLVEWLNTVYADKQNRATLVTAL